MFLIVVVASSLTWEKSLASSQVIYELFDSLPCVPVGKNTYEFLDFDPLIKVAGGCQVLVLCRVVRG